MTTNVGTIDRILRAVFGAGLLYIGFLSSLPLVETPFATYGAALIGIVLLATSALKMCPLYSILGIKTCRTC